MSMETKRRLKIIAAVLMIICIAVTAGIIIFRPSTNALDPTGRTLVITDLNVGKADAAIVCYGEITGLIDTGKEDAYERIDGWLKSHDITEIDYMILSHFDKDHIGSAVEILQNYHVKTVYYPDYVSSKKGYEPLMEELSNDKEDLTAVAVDSEMTIQYDDLTIELLPAEDAASLLAGDKPDNNMSLMCRYDLGNKKMLFTGDIENARMEQLVNGSDDLSADWIKLPHHGGYEKNEKEFLKRVAPSLGVISTNEEREPEERLINYLDKKKIKYFITMNGDVTTVCDGYSVNMEQN